MIFFRFIIFAIYLHIVEYSQTRKENKMVVHKTLCCCCVPLHARCIVIGVLELKLLAVLYAWDPTVFEIGEWSVWLQIFSAIYAVPSGLLIYGGIARKRFYMWPWVIFTFILNILVVIALFVCASACFNALDPSYILTYFGLPADRALVTTILVAAFCMAFIPTHIYFIVVVTEYMYELGFTASRQSSQSNNVRAQPDTYNMAHLGQGIR